MSERRNPDFSASAVNLINPSSQAQRLNELHAWQSKVSQLDAVLRAMPEYEELKTAESQVNLITERIKTFIDIEGSYQDVNSGVYAVKQRRLSKQYNAELFEATYPEYAPAIIKKAVDTVKLNGLVKGGLVSEDTMRQTLVMTETETFAYIIK